MSTRPSVSSPNISPGASAFSQEASSHSLGWCTYDVHTFKQLISTIITFEDNLLSPCGRHTCPCPLTWPPRHAQAICLIPSSREKTRTDAATDADFQISSRENKHLVND